MACDMFCRGRAQELLLGKNIYFFGDSNMRALYKDLTWLLEDGRLISQASLKSKNELSHANDVRISNGMLHSGRNYEEVRDYNGECFINFQFITRLNLPSFTNTIRNLHRRPDIIIINSCVWDLTRWGSSGVEQFKKNVFKTFSFLKSELPSTRIIWLSTFPPCFKSMGGFWTQEIEFLRNMLPWHVMYANKYASDVASLLNIDVLDMHYHFRFLMNYHAKDGIHWAPKTVRYATNLLLTHIALICNKTLPGEFELDNVFIQGTQAVSDESKQTGRFNDMVQTGWQNKEPHNNKAINTHNQQGFGNVSQSHHSFSVIRDTLMSAQNQLNIAPNATQCTFDSNNTQKNINVQGSGRITKKKKKKRAKLVNVVRNIMHM